MSEITHYYAVKKKPLEEIKDKLETADILSAIVDTVFSNELARIDYNWVVIEAPLITEFKVPGDVSTFSVISNPWEKLKDTFSEIIELYIEEGQKDWVLRSSLNNVHKEFKFYRNSKIEISLNDQKYLNELFSISFDQIESVLMPEKVFEFCQKVRLPYLEMEDQDQLKDVISNFGKVVFTSEFTD